MGEIGNSLLYRRDGCGACIEVFPSFLLSTQGSAPQISYYSSKTPHVRCLVKRNLDLVVFFAFTSTLLVSSSGSRLRPYSRLRNRAVCFSAWSVLSSFDLLTFSAVHGDNILGVAEFAFFFFCD